MKAKKGFIYLTMVLLLAMANNGVNACAAEAAAVVNNMEDVSIVPYAEETKWFFRIVDGRLQKRLWSMTYAKWLTEWEWT